MSPSFSAPLLSRCLPLFPALTLTISNACPRETVQSPLEDTPCPFLPVYAPHERKRNFRRNPVSSAETPSGFCVFPILFLFVSGNAACATPANFRAKKKMQGAAMSCLIPSFNCSVITCLNAHSWRASLKKNNNKKASYLKDTRVWRNTAVRRNRSPDLRNQISESFRLCTLVQWFGAFPFKTRKLTSLRLPMFE